MLAEHAAAGHLLALERGEPSRRYVLCGEVTPFGRVLHTFAGLVGGTRVRALPPGSTLGPDVGSFARRSEVYGKFPPVHVDDRGARGLGFAPRGVDEGPGAHRGVDWPAGLTAPFPTHPGRRNGSTDQ